MVKQIHSALNFRLITLLLTVLIVLISPISIAAEKIFLTQLQTLNNTSNPLNQTLAPWLTVAVSNLDANGVDVALERAESSVGDVAVTEQIGYVVLPGDFDGRMLDSEGSSIEFVTQQVLVSGWGNGCKSVDQSLSTIETTLLIASQNSRNGGDGGWVRRCHSKQSKFGLAIDEDIKLDSERKHTNELVSLMGFSNAFASRFESINQRWQIEAGQLIAKSTVNNSALTHIQFQQHYDVPPVVIVLPGAEGSDPVSVRIKNVTGNGFDIRLVEPAGSDDKHLAQNLHYLALTPGKHILSDGTMIEAGVHNTQAVQSGRGVSGKKSWSHIQFQTDNSNNPAPQQEHLTAAAAARFLTQASFGPTDQSISQLTETGSYQTWLRQQIAAPASYQLQPTQDYWLQNCPLNEEGRLINSPSEIADTWEASLGRHNIWWKTVLNGEDQLRQRVAFALSQIFVVSDKPQMLENSQFGMASYYDTLIKHAFGNYRDLLEEVTVHPVMGLYLGMLRNQKADLEHNIRPDENYAREVLQLFSIGVHQLNIDGTLKLDNGLPIATYDQATIQEFARIFTGWNYADVDWREWIGNGNRTLPMMPVEEFHDLGAKRLLNGLELPAQQNARTDLNAALDNIFQHPNVGPFISKQLIQRLVTSNPTPEYVARVASVFNDNGNAVRGDLGAVITAILLDDEARNGHKTLPAFGKLREPLLRLTHAYRAFELQPNKQEGSFWEHESCGRGEYPAYVMGNSWSHLASLEVEIGQANLRSPSVFNFYRPDYVPAGLAADNSLVAPEFQLASENFVVNTANLINYTLFWAKPVTGVNNPGYSWLDLSKVTALANNSDTLLNFLNRVLLNGKMSDQLRNIIKQHLADPGFQYHDEVELDKAKDAIALILISPEYLIQQ